MDGQYTLNALDLKNQYILHNQVQTIATVQLDALVFHGQRNLSFKTYTAEIQLMAQTLFVSRLQQSRTKSTLHFDSSANDALGSS